MGSSIWRNSVLGDAVETQEGIREACIIEDGGVWVCTKKTWRSRWSLTEFEKYSLLATNIPIPSMYGVYTYIYHKNQPNVCKYTIHGSYGNIIIHYWKEKFPKFHYGRICINFPWVERRCSNKWLISLVGKVPFVSNETPTHVEVIWVTKV